MKTVTEFITLLIVLNKMIAYKFLRGVLPRLLDRSHLVMLVFHLAILALVNIDCFSLVLTKVSSW